MIYLIGLTRIPSRACCVALLIWLTAAWSFPTCCWSMTASSSETAGAQHHSTRAADPHADHREHHQSAALRATASSAQASLEAAMVDCAAEREVAIITTGTSRTFKSVLASGPAAPFVIRTHAIRLGSRQPQLAPPGSPGADSAFLSPLRI